jgi:hypothetical protein
MAKVSLEEFIYETLSAISQGVMRAKRQSEQQDGIPIALSGIGGKETEHGEQLIRFSVSLEVSEGKEVAGSAEVSGGFISVFSGRVGAEAGKSSNDKSAHVIEFSVPMNFNAKWRKENPKC